MRLPTFCTGAFALLLPLLCHAHDSWLTLPRTAPATTSELALELTTGNRYPVGEFAAYPDSVQQARCSDGTADVALRTGTMLPNRLQLSPARAAAAAPLLACSLALAEAEVEIEPALVKVYFDEARPSPEVRAAWAAQQAQGIVWRESYRKHARIELPAMAQADAPRRAQARRPAGLGLEVVVLGDQAIAAGQAVDFQVLRDGQPLAGFPLELVSERSALGIWRTTDAQGRLRHTLPFGGQWLLRGIDLRVPEAPGQHWRSRFATLVFYAS